MAKLTKKEIAARAAAEQQARERAALRWSDDDAVAPDVPPPQHGSELTTGWLFNTYTRRVDVAYSSAIFHAWGRTDRTITQGARWLFSTRERALRALRVAMEQEFAAALARVDAQIEREQANG